jgi:hypothetical protein
VEGFCDKRSNLPISHSTGTQTHLLPSFDAHLETASINKTEGGGDVFGLNHGF